MQYALSKYLYNMNFSIITEFFIQLYNLLQIFFSIFFWY